MSEQQTNWRQVKIGELLAEHSERSISSNQHEVLSVTKDGIFSQREYFRKQIASENNSGYKIVRRGDVVFSAMNLWMGSIDVVRDQEIGIVSPAYITMRPTSELIDTGFLGYFLRGEEMRRKYVLHSQQGASIVRRNLNKDDLLDDEVFIPPLPEQKKIAEILSGIDAEMNCLAKKREQCSIVLQTICEDLFNNYNREFPSLELAEACSVITKGATPTTFGHELSGIRFPGAVTFLGGGSTSGSGEFDLSPARYCAAEAVSTLKRSELRAGDTLITIVGASIGNTCQIPKSALPANINQNVALVRGDKSVLDNNYLNLYLRSEGRRALMNIATTQAQPSVSLKQVGELRIPIPPISEQCRIGEAVTSIRSFMNHLERKTQAIQVLKDALSADLLSGRRRVSV